MESHSKLKYHMYNLRLNLFYIFAPLICHYRDVIIHDVCHIYGAQNARRIYVAKKTAHKTWHDITSQHSTIPFPVTEEECIVYKKPLRLKWAICIMTSYTTKSRVLCLISFVRSFNNAYANSSYRRWERESNEPIVMKT